MKKNINFINVILAICFILTSITIVICSKITFSIDSGKIIRFYRSEGDRLLTVCTTGANGIIDLNTCYSSYNKPFDTICSKWADKALPSQGTSITSADVKSKQHTDDHKYYCLSNTSSGGYQPIAQCYNCNGTYIWDTLQIPNDGVGCSIVGTNKDECVTPSACYICSGKYTWTNNPASGCEKQNNITSQTYCKEAEKKCYICDGDYIWTNNPSNSCKEYSQITDEKNCAIENPKTADSSKILIFTLFIIGFVSIGYSFWCFKGIHKNY